MLLENFSVLSKIVPQALILLDWLPLDDGGDGLRLLSLLREKVTIISLVFVSVELKTTAATPLHKVLQCGAVVLFLAREEGQEDYVVSKFDKMAVRMDGSAVVCV